MSNNENIENLRKTISIANENSVIGEEYAKLIKHPELTWNDLIVFLRFKLVIGECASFKLHEFLSVPFPPEGPIREQNEWQKILREKQIKLSDFVHEKKNRFKRVRSFFWQ